MRNPPPAPPPSGGGPPMVPPGGGGAMAVPGNLASPGLRIVGGLIDVILLGIVAGIMNRLINDQRGFISLVIGLVLYVGYFACFWSQAGPPVGSMGFRIKSRHRRAG